MGLTLGLAVKITQSNITTCGKTAIQIHQ